ncbi:MAG: DMT family transporter [Pseudomonadota bacterium]
MTNAPSGPASSAAGLAHRPLLAIVFMLAAVGLFATTDLLVKFAAPEIGTIELLFFRMIFGMLPLIPLMMHEAGHSRIWEMLYTQRFVMHTVRSLIACLFLTLYFVSVVLLPLADAYAIGFAAPLWVAALSVPILGEKVGVRRWAAIVVGLIGVMVILRPGGGVLSVGGLAGLAATVLFAISMILIRIMSRTESSSSIVFYFQAYAILLTGLLLLVAIAVPEFGQIWGGFFGWTMPSTTQLWMILVGIGLIGGIGQVCITLSYRYAEAVVVSPFTYTSILWGLGYGIFLFGDYPVPLTLVGAAIVIASGIYLLLRETQLKKASNPAES